MLLKKRIIKITLICILSIISSVLILLIFCIWLISWGWGPSFSIGPFLGTPRDKCPKESPDQEMKINRDFILKVFDKKEGEPAPTVMLQKVNEEILWCIYTTGDKAGNFEKIRFIRYRKFPFSEIRVKGWVDWGRNSIETTLWLIDEKGRLIEYRTTF